MGLNIDFSISINGVGISEELKKRVISLKISDSAGIQSDSCFIELDDYDDSLPLPRSEAILVVSIGYKETGIRELGRYYTKEITLNGGRRTMQIYGHAVSKAMMSEKDKSRSKEKLDSVLSSMASEYGLDSVIDLEYHDEELSDAQIGESDISYLTRKAVDLGAVSKPTASKLLFANDMSGASVTGKKLQPVIINLSDITDYSCSLKDSENGYATESNVGTVYAEWQDKSSGVVHIVHAGTGEPERKLPQRFSNEKEAMSACIGKQKRLVKNSKTFSFSCVGNPNLMAEHPVVLAGFPSKIPTNWIITHAEHIIDSSGYKTRVECAIR